MRKFDPGYDELQQGTVVRVLSGPANMTCGQIPQTYYEVAVVGPASRDHNSTGWVNCSAFR